MVMQINSTLWKEVQEYIDQNYDSAREGDGIDWAQARVDAHSALDGRFSKEEVKRTLDEYQS
jgi:hypothetical protein